VGAGVALAVLLATGVVALGWQGSTTPGAADPEPPSAVGTDVVAPGAGGVEVQPDPALDRPLEDERAVEPGSAAVAVDGETSEGDGSLGRSRPT